MKPRKAAMRRLSVTIVSLLGVGGAASVNAGYDANASGVITNVMTYQGGTILFKLSNQPTTHPVCTASYFAIDSTKPDAEVARIYARVLSAFHVGQTITIGYDSQGDCVGSYIRVWRVG